MAALASTATPLAGTGFSTTHSVASYGCSNQENPLRQELPARKGRPKSQARRQCKQPKLVCEYRQQQQRQSTEDGGSARVVAQLQEERKLSDPAVFIRVGRRPKNKRSAMTDAGARRVINERLEWESQLRHNQGPQATKGLKRWLHRTPEQMAQFLADGRMEYQYPMHVDRAIRTVRGLGNKPRGSYDFGLVMNPWVGCLSFKEMCNVLKEQNGWLQARDFFQWMKLQGCYRPSVIPYTILIKLYAQVGRLDLVEGLYNEMLTAGCEPDEVIICSMICVFARSGKIDNMMEFYTMMRTQGLVPPVVVFNMTLSALYKEGLYSDAIYLWDEWLKSGAKPNEYTYAVAVNMYRKACRFEEAVHVFEQMMQAGHLPDEMLYSIAINMLGKLGRLSSAVELFERLKLQGLVPSKYIYTSLVHHFCKAGDYNAAIKYFSEMQSRGFPADEVMYGTIITLYSKLGMYKDAEQAFWEMDGAGLVMTERIFFVMANMFMKNKRHSDALRLLEDMQSRGFKLTKYGWRIRLQCFIQQCNLSQAESAFQMMLTHGFADTVAYTCMFTFYKRMQYFEGGKGLLASLQATALKPDEELYGAIIDLFCSGGSLEQAEWLIVEMQNRGLSPNRTIKTMLMQAYGKAGRFAEAEKLFKSLDSRDSTAMAVMFNTYNCCGRKEDAMTLSKLLLDSDVSAYCRLITNFARRGDLETVEFLFHQLEEGGILPSEKLIVSIIAMLGRRKQWQKALDLFERSCHSELASSISVHNAMIDAFIKCGKLAEAHKLFERLKEMDLPYNHVTITMMVNGYGKAGMFTEAVSLIKSSRDCSTQFDTAAYNTFIKLNLDAGNVDEALDLLLEMQSTGLLPSIETYSIMISAFGKAGDIGKAAEVFDLVRDSGCALDETLYGVMIDQYGKAGKQKEAVALFKEMQDRGIQPQEHGSWELANQSPHIDQYKSSRSSMMRVSNNGNSQMHLTCKGEEEKVEELFKEMQSKGIVSKPGSYLPLFLVYGRKGMYNKVENLFQEMLSKGLMPEIKHYQELMIAYGKAKMATEAYSVYKDIRKAQLLPDHVCQKTMLQIFLNNRCFDEGVRFYEETSGGMTDDAVLMRLAVDAYEGCARYAEARELLKQLERQGIQRKH